MSWEEQGQLFRSTAIANSNLAAKQYFAVSLVSGYKINLATANKNAIGILQDNPASGIEGTYQWDGISKAVISASQTLTAGTSLLQVDSGGTLTAVTSTNTVVAVALETLVSVANTVIIA